MTDGPSLGRLERVELRRAWSYEATDFTPWLASAVNIGLLGDAIGIDLEVQAQAASVGPFRADILCRDTATGHFVLVENQLERTDHIHLGQLLTYAAGLDAVTVVWVAAHFTDEHRAALDWLNRSTREDINFFGLEIELWSIPPSRMAPKFNVVSQPNDWSRVVKDQAAQSGQTTPAQQLYLEYWTQFHEFLRLVKSPVKVSRPSHQYWVNVGVGRVGFTLNAWNSVQQSFSGVSLILSGPNAKSQFRQLEAMHRAEVDAVLIPLGEVRWDLFPKLQMSQVSVRRPSSITERASWPDLNRWLATSVEAAHNMFRPLVAELDANPEGDAVGPLSDADERPPVGE